MLDLVPDGEMDLVLLRIEALGQQTGQRGGLQEEALAGCTSRRSWPDRGDMTHPGGVDPRQYRASSASRIPLVPTRGDQLRQLSACGAAILKADHGSEEEALGDGPAG